MHTNLQCFEMLEANLEQPLICTYFALSFTLTTFPNVPSPSVSIILSRTSRGMIDLLLLCSMYSKSRVDFDTYTDRAVHHDYDKSNDLPRRPQSSELALSSEERKRDRLMMQCWMLDGQLSVGA